MPGFVAGKIIQESVKLGMPMPPRIAVFGITYKADVPDTRNSKVVDLVRELQKFGAEVLVHDPLADPEEVVEEYGLRLSSQEYLIDCHVAVLAVLHSQYAEGGDWWPMVSSVLVSGTGLVADIPAMLDRDSVPEGVVLWRL